MPSAPASHIPGIDAARRLRADMPRAERLLWSRLRRSALGHRFRRQHPVGPYVLDFACVGLKVAVEVDGGSHFAGEAALAYDRQRTAVLEANGWTVVRLLNAEVMRDVGAACEAVRVACEEAVLRKARASD